MSRLLVTLALATVLTIVDAANRSVWRGCSSLSLFGDALDELPCPRRMAARSLTTHAPSDPDPSHSGTTVFNESAHYDIEIFTDRTFDLAPASAAKCKIALLWEPPAILSSMYMEFLKNATLRSHFDTVFTYNNDLLASNPALFARYLEPVSLVAKDMPVDHHPRRWTQRQAASTMNTAENDYFLACASAKQRGVSMILSSKAYAVGHSLRHQAWHLLRRTRPHAVTGCGEGAGRYVADKKECLLPYKFTIVIENDRDQGFYFSEKLVDAMLTATVPIVWGDGAFLSRLFDTKGMMFWSTLDELSAIIDALGDANNRSREYQQRMHALHCNYFKALPFATSLVDRLRAHVVAADGSVNCNVCPVR